MSKVVQHTGHIARPAVKRREFLYLSTGMAAAVGTGATLWPFIDSMRPSADVGALASIEIDLSPVELGQRLTLKWRGRPIFVVHRTQDMIARARADDANPALIDPAPDETRVKRPEWLILVGVCTHLGCIPLGQKDDDPRGPYGGWFCPCHGSIYDNAGRVRKGPAPRNLEVPPNEFLDDQRIRIG